MRATKKRELIKLLCDVPPEARPYVLRAIRLIARLTDQLQRARLKRR